MYTSILGEHARRSDPFRLFFLPPAKKVRKFYLLRIYKRIDFIERGGPWVLGLTEQISEHIWVADLRPYSAFFFIWHNKIIYLHVCERIEISDQKNFLLAEEERLKWISCFGV
ncbi:hypothetical protein ACFFSY_29355 [Paenibacillus aurantiacus]|uniref:Uncharacterized protein n=1 Tax=Paenibacillus aurantiacus TaxID=1936118 RepID=A0ABV5KXW1_9BACL